VKVNIKNQDKLKLEDLLRRRKTSFEEFVKSHAIYSYSSLLEICKRIGVTPPVEDNVKDFFVEQIASDEQEGIVVVEISTKENLSHSEEESKSGEHLYTTDFLNDLQESNVLSSSSLDVTDTNTSKRRKKKTDS
jgi:hypothetical protein